MEEVCIPKITLDGLIERIAKIENEVVTRCWNYCTMFDMDTRKLLILRYELYPGFRKEIRYGDDIVIGWFELNDCKITYSYPKF